MCGRLYAIHVQLSNLVDFYNTPNWPKQQGGKQAAVQHYVQRQVIYVPEYACANRMNYHLQRNKFDGHNHSSVKIVNSQMDRLAKYINVQTNVARDTCYVCLQEFMLPEAWPMNDICSNMP